MTRSRIELPIGAVLCGADRFHVGSLAIEGDRVAELTHGSGGGPLWAIPGLQNAHAHLDLSLVRGVRRAERGFGAWVLDLLAHRGPFDPGFLQRGAAAGAREALRTGTTAIADIDSSGAAAIALATSGLKGWACREVLGTGPSEPALRAAKEWLNGFEGFAPGGRIRPALSPHAPYSTPEALYRGVADLARRHDIPVTTHIAETMAEREFLATGGGEFRELLDRLGAAAPFAAPPGLGPIRYLDELGCLGPRTLLVHANYPDDDEIERVVRSRAAVVYCPRSHNFFHHRGPHPVRAFLDAGVPVALGTDSRASNSSLSMLDEIAYLRVARTDLQPEEIFRAATETGAHLLSGEGGRLEPGAPADLAIVRTPGGCPGDRAEAVDLITSGSSNVTVVATLVSGEVCFAEPEVGPALLPLTQEGSRLWSADSGGAESV